MERNLVMKQISDNFYCSELLQVWQEGKTVKKYLEGHTITISKHESNRFKVVIHQDIGKAWQFLAKSGEFKQIRRVIERKKNQDIRINRLLAQVDKIRRNGGIQ